MIVCPQRFDQDNVLPKWLARIVGFPDAKVAREIPFMRSPVNGRLAGRIDRIVASDSDASAWYALEIQAVYFSGSNMTMEFEQLARDSGRLPPASIKNRRPDWRSSSAKRLMPQLQVKAPTLRRWGTKLAVESMTVVHKTKPLTS